MSDLIMLLCAPAIIRAIMGGVAVSRSNRRERLTLMVLLKESTTEMHCRNNSECEPLREQRVTGAYTFPINPPHNGHKSELKHATTARAGTPFVIALIVIACLLALSG